MNGDLTHASFFSGVGGLDLGLERAGWRTVSFSEIDPYACAVLAERWPGVPNLGDITRLDPNLRPQDAGSWTAASLWSGGFPCQDLSVAGKRRGLAGSRSGLAFAFLDLVERYRPPAILLENVPGLLSSHRGRDMAALVGLLGELGYGWAYRILDAQHFGVPQRRRRVFIVALDARRGPGADSAAEVLSVGSRCQRHPAPGVEAGEGAPARTADGSDLVGTVTRRLHKGTNSTVDEGALIVGSLTAGGIERNATQNVVAGHFIAPTLDSSDGREGRDHPGRYVVGSLRASGSRYPVSANDEGRLVLGTASDADGVRAPDGLAGRLDDHDGLAATLNSGGNSGGFRTEPGEHLIPTLRVGPATIRDGGPGDTVPIILQDGRAIKKAQNGSGWSDAGLDLLPLGLDSHRYRCCGNGVVSSVAEWIGLRLAEVLA